jgi:hypothetical protein
LLDGLETDDFKQEGPLRLIDGKLVVSLVPEVGKEHLYGQDYSEVELVDSQGRKIVVRQPIKRKASSASTIQGDMSQFGGSSNESLNNILAVINNRELDVAKVEQKDGRKIIVLKPKIGSLSKFTGG